MKLQQLKCPNCDGTLELKVQDSSKEIFCPYCGNAFIPEDNTITYNYNENKNIKKSYNVSFGHQKTDKQTETEAELEAIREANRLEAFKYKMMFTLVFIGLLVLAFIAFLIAVS